jgi:anti-sigma B factor antagonist
VPRPSVVVELVEVVGVPAGELDVAVQSHMIKAYRRAIALQAEPRIVVDLSRVTFMDSTALGTLVAAMKKVQVRGGTLSVVGASDRIAGLFHITGLDTVLASWGEAAVSSSVGSTPETSVLSDPRPDEDRAPPVPT